MVDLPLIEDLIGIIAAIISLLSYIPYIRSILKKRTTPHLISWIIFTALSIGAFLGQWFNGAEAGSFVTASMVITNMAVLLLALKFGEPTIYKTDYACLIGAILIIPCWFYTHNDALAMFLITAVTYLGFLPVLRKIWTKPSSEHLSIYAVSLLKFSLGLIAIEHYNFETSFYPAALIAINLFLIALVWARKKVSKRS